MTPSAKIAAPAWHAARILEAWECHDKGAFRRAVAITLDLPFQAGTYLQEQAELLNTVADRLCRCPELLEQGRSRPDGRACMALLNHLASRS